MLMVLGYRIRRLRKERALSQAQLGKLLGVSKVSISGYEKGTRIPSINTLLKLIDVLEISADYIFGREVNAVCEDDDTLNVFLSSDDINIIREIKKNNSLYNKIAKEPKRFFASVNKKNI